jgi:hypothetical protein
MEDLNIKAANLFEADYEKWKAYLDIANRKEQIETIWFRKLQSEIVKQNNATHNLDWKLYTVPTNGNCCWHISLDNDPYKSLNIWWEPNEIKNLSLYAYNKNFDSNKLNTILNDSNNKKQLLKYFKGETSINPGDYKLQIKLSFDTINDLTPSYGIEEFAWYSQKHSTEIAKEILALINEIKMDENIVNLFKKCNATLKNNK